MDSGIKVGYIKRVSSEIEHDSSLGHAAKAATDCLRLFHFRIPFYGGPVSRGLKNSACKTLRVSQVCQLGIGLPPFLTVWSSSCFGHKLERHHGQ